MPPFEYDNEKKAVYNFIKSNISNMIIYYMIIPKFYETNMLFYIFYTCTVFLNAKDVWIKESSILEIISKLQINRFVLIIYRCLLQGKD